MRAHAAAGLPTTAWVVMAKAPVPGLAKTRLMPALGAQGATTLAALMLRHTLTQVLAVAQAVDSVGLACAPHAQHPAWVAALAPVAAEGLTRLKRFNQPDGGLGSRMLAAARWGLARAPQVVLMGTDAPALTAAHLRQAAQALATHPAALGSTLDGGYVWIGLRQDAPTLFDDAHFTWGTARVADQTRERLQALGWAWAEGAPLADVDTPDDLMHLPPSWLAAARAPGPVAQHDAERG